MPASAQPGTPAHRQSPEPTVALLIAFVSAVLVVVAAIAIFVVTDSEALRAVALVLHAAVTIGLVVYLYDLLVRTRGPAAAERPSGEPTLQLGDEVSAERMRTVIVAALRDAHALQRGTQRFAEAARRRLGDATQTGESSRMVAELLDRQRDLAAAEERRLVERLEVLGRHSGRVADDELLVGEWLYERLLAHSVLTNARHGYGLAHLAATSYAMLGRLSTAAGDQESRQLAIAARADADALGEAWAGAWDAVLDLAAAQSGQNGNAAVRQLLEEAEAMEAMRARLLKVTAAQGREAGIASGAEEAGLDGVLDAIDRESNEVDEHLRLVRERMQAVGHRTPRLHAWETFAAARATAMAEHVRGYKLARDVRDIVASDQLEVATYELLERAARRAGDATTAELAAELRGQAADGSKRGTASLDGALEVALLNE
jgi:hypothetical protein